MIHRLGHLFLILALLVSTGGHWALLQSVAWTTMLAEHMQSENFADAVKQTFDGEHPCKLCCAIRAAKKAGQKTEFPLAQQKLEFPPLTPALVLYAPAAFEHLLPRNRFADSSIRPPPTPPPRTGSV